MADVSLSTLPTMAATATAAGAPAGLAGAEATVDGTSPFATLLTALGEPAVTTTGVAPALMPLPLPLPLPGRGMPVAAIADAAILPALPDVALPAPDRAAPKAETDGDAAPGERDGLDPASALTPDLSAFLALISPAPQPVVAPKLARAATPGTAAPATVATAAVTIPTVRMPAEATGRAPIVAAQLGQDIVRTAVTRTALRDEATLSTASLAPAPSDPSQPIAPAQATTPLVLPSIPETKSGPAPTPTWSVATTTRPALTGKVDTARSQPAAVTRTPITLSTVPTVAIRTADAPPAKPLDVMPVAVSPTAVPITAAAPTDAPIPAEPTTVITLETAATTIVPAPANARPIAVEAPIVTSKEALPATEAASSPVATPPQGAGAAPRARDATPSAVALPGASQTDPVPVAIQAAAGAAVVVPAAAPAGQPTDPTQIAASIPDAGPAARTPDAAPPAETPPARRMDAATAAPAAASATPAETPRPVPMRARKLQETARIGDVRTDAAPARGDVAAILQTVPAPPADDPVARQLSIAQDGQWLDSLARDIASAGNTNGRLDFRLDPDHLGSLTVQILQGSDGASIRLTASNEAARTILADAQPQLLAEARAHGLTVRDATVETRTSSPATAPASAQASFGGSGGNGGRGEQGGVAAQLQQQSQQQGGSRQRAPDQPRQANPAPIRPTSPRSGADLYA